MNYIDFKPKAKTTTLEVIDQEKVSNQDVQDLKKLMTESNDQTNRKIDLMMNNMSSLTMQMMNFQEKVDKIFSNCGLVQEQERQQSC